jgi:hypothetical protein
MTRLSKRHSGQGRNAASKSSFYADPEFFRF